MFSRKLCQLGQEHPELVAVTAAMPDGTGLVAFGKKFPDRFFDVGIAEAHGVTSAAGMAAAGLRPVVAVYSSFLQRAYDQVLHDVLYPEPAGAICSGPGRACGEATGRPIRESLTIPS
ncbi:MAG: hypothetical protein ACLTBV_32240 [Enterocloster bolteae]